MLSVGGVRTGSSGRSSPGTLPLRVVSHPSMAGSGLGDTVPTGRYQECEQKHTRSLKVGDRAIPDSRARGRDITIVREERPVGT